MGQVVRAAGRSAAGQIEPEAEFLEQRELEARKRHPRLQALTLEVEDAERETQQAVVRIALREQAQMLAEQLAGIEALPVGDQRRGTRLQQFEGEGAEVILEPRPPSELDRIPGLQGGRKFRRSAATYQPQVPSPAVDQDLGDD